MPTMEEGIAAAGAWTQKHGVTPAVQVRSKDTVTGERLSNDEMGMRSTGYRTWSIHVSPYGMCKDTIADWVQCTQSFDDDDNVRERAAIKVIEACWSVLEVEALPSRESRELIAERDYTPLPMGNKDAEWCRRATKKTSLYFVRGPLGRYIEATYTFPNGSAALKGQVYTQRLLLRDARPSKAQAGAWLMIDGGGNILIRISSEEYGCLSQRVAVQRS